MVVPVGGRARRVSVRLGRHICGENLPTEMIGDTQHLSEIVPMLANWVNPGPRGTEVSDLRQPPRVVALSLGTVCSSLQVVVFVQLGCVTK